MNKTRKNKYLRKNRHSKHSKHGNKNKKTRKVQRGGQPGRPTVVGASSQTYTEPQQLRMVVKLRSPPDHRAPAAPEVVDTKSPSSEDPVLEAARIQQDALKKSENEQKPPSPMWGVVPQSWAAAAAGLAAGIGAESRDALSKAEASVAHQGIIGTIIENSNKNIALGIETSETYRERLDELNKQNITPEIIAEKEHITNALNSQTEFIDTQENNLPKLNMADKTGNLALFETPMGMGMGPGMGPGMMDSRGSVHKNSPPPPPPKGGPAAEAAKVYAEKPAAAAEKAQPSPAAAPPALPRKGGPAAAAAAAAAAAETKAAASAAEKAQPSPAAAQPSPAAAQPSPAAAQPSLTGNIRKAFENAATATRKIFSKKSPEEVAAAAQAEAKRKAEAQALKAAQINTEQTATHKLKRVEGKTVKSRVSKQLTNMGNSVRQRYISLKNRLTRKKNNNEDKEPLIPEEGVVTKASSITPPSDNQTKTWRDKLPKLPKLPNFLKIKNNNKEAPDSSQPTSSATPPPTAADTASPSPTEQRVVSPPPPPTATPASQTMRPPLPPPRPKSFPLPAAETPTNPQAGGNITRKNRQYIHEIKDNRTQLFNKEMEIINSIRNFKHGHHYGKGRNENGKNKPENIQKKFIKVIKRS